MQAAGFTRPSVLELKAQFETDQRAEISAALDLSTESVLGQLNGIYARHLGLAWEALEGAYHAFDPGEAEDDRLTALAKLTGTDRRGASKSEVNVRVALEVGTTLEAGVHFAHVTTKPDVRFTPKANFTAPVSGEQSVAFESEITGPVQAAAETLTVIATPVVGWSSVNNPLEAVPGRNIDSDGDLRLRREQQLARSGSGTVDAIRADVLSVEDVTSAQVFENFSDITDANGLPPHSFEVVLFDDAGADDDEVAQAIWNSKPAGIKAYGSEPGNATDANGDVHAMHFSRAAIVSVYIEFDLTARDGYVGDAAFELAVASAMDSSLGTGDAVNFYDVLIATEGLGARVTALRFGTAPSPTGDAEIAITNRQIARFDTSRIAIFR